MGSVLLTPPHHSWLFAQWFLHRSLLIHSGLPWENVSFCREFTDRKESVHSIILPSFFFCPVSFPFSVFFFPISLHLSNTLVHKHYSFSYTLRPTPNSYLSHVYTNTSAFTYSNVFSLAVCSCCVKQHPCVCFLHATTDLATYRYPSHFSLPSFPSSHVKVKANPRSPLTLDSDEACPCHQHCWSWVVCPLGKA